jgi:hypothetical protein
MATTRKSTPEDLAALAALNVRFGEEEEKGASGREFFEGVLAARFYFRRGDGSVDTRDAFLKGLGDPDNSTDLLTTEIVQVQLLGKQAFVEALVRFKGKRRGKKAAGVFRNLRLFERQPEGWRCVMWFNKKVGELESEPA